MVPMNQVCGVQGYPTSSLVPVQRAAKDLGFQSPLDIAMVRACRRGEGKRRGDCRPSR
jgi:hypothetical protein